MENIDPVEYGKLLGKVDALSEKVECMESDLKELLALANKGKGGFWAGMMMASVLGSIASWFVSHMGK